MTKTLLLTTYRSLIKHLYSMADPFIKQKLLAQLYPRVNIQPTSKAQQQKRNLSDMQSLESLVAKARSGHKNSILKLIRLCTNNSIYPDWILHHKTPQSQPIQMLKLKNYPGFLALSTAQQHMIKSVVWDCCKLDKTQYNSFSQYAVDAQSQANQAGYLALGPQLRRLISEKIRKRQKYYSQYYTLFGELLDIVIDPEENLINEFVNSNYTILL